MKILFLGLAAGLTAVFYFVFISRQKFEKVKIYNRDGRQIAEFRAEIADNSGKRAQGLMFRKSLPENQGMLFVFPYKSNHTFWMMNTFLPLDIIFADENKEIVGIIENTTPKSLQPLTIDKPSKYVLEINSGRVEELGIKKGQKIER